jgi:hypothetical protein
MAMVSRSPAVSVAVGVMRHLWRLRRGQRRCRGSGEGDEDVAEGGATHDEIGDLDADGVEGADDCGGGGGAAGDGNDEPAVVVGDRWAGGEVLEGLKRGVGVGGVW